MSREKATKDKIIEAACTLFADQGYNGVSIRAIAKEAAVNLAAVNYHFSSKAALYGQIIKNAKIKFSEKVDALDTENMTTQEIAMTFYDMYLTNGNQLRHTFALLLTESPIDGFDDITEQDDIGPPGERVLIAAITRDFDSELSTEAIEWAVGSIFSQITHTALLAETSVMKKICKLHADRFSKERIRTNLEHSVKGILIYLEQNHLNIR